MLEFQSTGALMAKAPSPFVTKCDLGVTGWAPSADVSGQEGTRSINVKCTLGLGRLKP